MTEIKSVGNVGAAAPRKVDSQQWCGSFEPMRIPRPKFSDMEWIPPNEGAKTGYYRSVRRKQRRAYPALPQEFQRQLEAKINNGGSIPSNGSTAPQTPSNDRKKVFYHNTVGQTDSKWSLKNWILIGVIWFEINAVIAFLNAEKFSTFSYRSNPKAFRVSMAKTDLGRFWPKITIEHRIKAVIGIVFVKMARHGRPC